MAMKPYPSNLIIFNIDEGVFSNDLKLSIIRGWTHIGEVLVRTHEGAEGEAPCNYIHVMVKYGTRRYLAADGGESDANWTERMEQHLKSTMRKIGDNMIAFNRHHRKTGEEELALDYIEFELEGGALTLQYRLDSNGALPVECAAIATDIRSCLGEGILGTPVRVIAPSARSYAEQAQAAAIAAAQAAAKAEEEREEREAAEEQAREEAEKEAEEQFMESPELAAQVAEEEAAEKPASPLEVAPLTDEEWEALYGVREADFAIDYGIWEVVYADGTTREYDSNTNEFVA